MYKKRNTKKEEYEEILAILREDWPDVDPLQVRPTCLLVTFAILLCTLAFHGHLCCTKLVLHCNLQINNKYMLIIYTGK